MIKIRKKKGMKKKDRKDGKKKMVKDKKNGEALMQKKTRRTKKE